MNLVTRYPKARVALGKSEQNVMYIDWKVGSGLRLCIASLTCCHPVESHKQGAKLCDGIVRYLLFMVLNVQCETAPLNRILKYHLTHYDIFLNRREVNRALGPFAAFL